MLSKTYTKYIQSLHHKKFRDIENAFIAEGSKVVMDLLNSSNIFCEHILGLDEWLRDHEQKIRKHYSGPLETIENFELDKISALSKANQVLAVFKKNDQVSFDPKDKITLMLDTIQDPGNLGTIIRIADWFGIEAIICSKSCADLYNPKVVQSTMGSLGRVKVIYTNLEEWLKINDTLPVFATTLDGKNIELIKGRKEGVIIIGNESQGISEDVMGKAKERITIPKIGQAESLNAAVATGIILSHL